MNRFSMPDQVFSEPLKPLHHWNPYKKFLETLSRIKNQDLTASFVTLYGFRIPSFFFNLYNNKIKLHFLHIFLIGWSEDMELEDVLETLNIWLMIRWVHVYITKSYYHYFMPTNKWLIASICHTKNATKLSLQKKDKFLEVLNIIKK